MLDQYKSLIQAVYFLDELKNSEEYKGHIIDNFLYFHK